MKQYEFSEAGVQAWQTDLYAMSENRQFAERSYIKEHFDIWLEDRFGLSPDQIYFLYSLGLDYVSLIQQELVSALLVHLPIQLEREPLSEPSGIVPRGGRDSVKVVELRKKLEEWREGDDEEEDPDPDPPVDPQVLGDSLENRVFSRNSNASGFFKLRIFHREI